MNKPLISVIIPTYQHSKTISHCVESVLHQTYPNIEIIVVDDGSTDGTQKKLKKYHGKINYIFQENQGSNPARNRGFSASQGDFVLFCDADIIMREDMLASLFSALNGHPEAAYAYSAFKFGWKKFKSFEFDSDKLKQMNYIHTSALIRREAFPGFDTEIKRFQDWDVWLTMLENGHQGVYVPEELFKVVIPKGREGISSWMPSLFYRLNWQRLRWKPKRVSKYEEAKEIIRKKHNL